MFTRSFTLMAGFVLAIALGCGAPTQEPAPPEVHDTVDALRTRLLEVAETGEGGSSLGDLYESVEKMKDRELAERLGRGLDQLDRAKSVEQRKQAAKKLAESF